MLKKVIIGVLSVFVIGLIAYITPQLQAADRPEVSFYIEIERKSSVQRGIIKLELFSDKAPISVENFMAYVKEDFYTNTIFHRVIDGFMIQGGGFEQDLRQKRVRAPIKNEASNGLSNVTGTVAMARTSDIDSATSQFFINVADNTFLDHAGPEPNRYGYTVFGKVIKGMDFVNELKGLPTTTVGFYRDVPVRSIRIVKVIIH